MTAASTTSEPTRRRVQTRARWVWAAAAVGVAMLAGAVAVLLAQVSVTDDDVDAVRTCGSALDGVLDRSGWEVWWARDLDEPDDAVRAALVRTEGCPAAVNARIVLAVLLGAAGALSLAVARRMSTERRRTATSAPTPRSNPVARLGRSTAIVGVVLTAGGLIAVFVLTADADSTLFLYTDRLVVALVGLIALVPAVVLIVVGRALTILGDRIDSRPPGESDD